jgi:hypothetical protein
VTTQALEGPQVGDGVEPMGELDLEVGAVAKAAATKEAQGELVKTSDLRIWPKGQIRRSEWGKPLKLLAEVTQRGARQKGGVPSVADFESDPVFAFLGRQGSGSCHSCSYRSLR